MMPPTATTAEALQPDAGAVLSKAVVRAARALGLRNSDVARVVGTSEASVSRMARGPTVEPRFQGG